MDENRANYVSKFNKENYKMYPFRVKRSDTKLIDKLDSVSNRNSYLTNLILEDVNPSVLTIKQIKEKRYKGKLANYLDNIVLVSINYDKETKKHECHIEMSDQ